MGKCRASVMVEPGKIVMEEFDRPEVAEDSALLKVEACGICGTDSHTFLGHRKNTQFLIIAGHEFIETIVELGSRANDTMAVFGGALKIGARVSVCPINMPHSKYPLPKTLFR